MKRFCSLGTAVCIECFLLLALISSSAYSAEKRLIRKLLERYGREGKYGRPVLHTNNTVLVRFQLAIRQLLDLDEKKEVLETMVWLRYTWYDHLLKWNPQEHDGLDSIRLPPEKLWYPDIVLYDAVKMSGLANAQYVVSPDGHVLWVPSYILKTSCTVKVTNFPFDTQECQFKFGPWSYDVTKVDIDFWEDKWEINMNNSLESSGWEFAEYPARRILEDYPCCDKPYSSLTFSLKLRRRSAFYGFVLIMPCLLLASLTLVIFFLPPNSSEKTNMGLNIFLSYFMLLLILVESLPHSAETIPRLGLYICANMSITCLSVFLSCAIVNLHERGERGRPVPKCVKQVIINGLGTLLKRQYKKDNSASDEGVPLYDVQRHFQHSVCRSPLAQCKMKRPGIEPFSTVLSPDQLQPICTNLRAIAKWVQLFGDRLAEKDNQEKIVGEWRIVAVILDRLFFFVYLIFNVVALITVFPRPT